MFPKIPRSRLKIQPITPRSKVIPSGTIQKMEGADLQRFILEYNPEEIKQARELWRKYAGRKDLIDFGKENAPTQLRIFE